MAQRHAIGRGGDRVIEHGAEGRRRRLEPVGAVQREISSHLAVSRSIVVHQDREGGRSWAATTIASGGNFGAVGPGYSTATIYLLRPRRTSLSVRSGRGREARIELLADLHCRRPGEAVAGGWFAAHVGC